MFPRKLFLTPNVPPELEGQELTEKVGEKQGVGDCRALLLQEVRRPGRLPERQEGGGWAPGLEKSGG